MLSLFQSRSFVTIFFGGRSAFFQFMLLLGVLLPSKFALVSTFINKEKQNTFKQHGGVRRLTMKGKVLFKLKLNDRKTHASLLLFLEQDAPPTTHPLLTRAYGNNLVHININVRAHTHRRVVSLHTHKYLFMETMIMNS